MMITSKQTQDLMFLLRRMNLQKQEIMEIAAAIETQEELYLFLTKLSEKHYEMSPEEVYQASMDTIMELYQA